MYMYLIMASFSNLFLTKLFLIFFMVDTVHAECGLGWIHFNNLCYLFSSDAYNWLDAQSSCRAHNARLAEPQNKIQSDYLISMAKSIGKHVHYWLGGRDDVVEGIWQWSSSDHIITYTPWSPNQPDNAGGIEDCLQMAYSHQFQWNDGKCKVERNYICERGYPGTETEVIG